MTRSSIPPTKPAKSFNVQFGLLYCIAIILVVTNHARNGGFRIFGTQFPWTTCALSIFAFCSGYFYINNKDRKPLFIIKNKILKFIAPLLIWNLLYGILVTILKHFDIINFGGDLALDNLFLAPFWNGHQFIFNLSAWFVTPLFIIEIINIPAIKVLTKRPKLLLPYFLICLSIGFLGVQFAINGHNQGWELLLDKICLFLPFFSAGILYRNKLEQKIAISNIPFFSLIICTALILIFFNKGPVNFGPSWAENFGTFFLPFLNDFIGIAFWLRITKILAPAFNDSRIVKTISSNTFGIMMHHLLGFFVLNSIIFIIYKITGHPQFNQSQYSTNIWYLALPNMFPQFGILYVIFAIAFSISIQHASNWVTKFLVRAPSLVHSNHQGRKKSVRNTS